MVALLFAAIRPGFASAAALAVGFAAVVLAAIVVPYIAWPFQSVPHVDDEGPYGGCWLGWVEYGGCGSALEVLAAVALVVPPLGRVSRRT